MQLSPGLTDLPVPSVCAGGGGAAGGSLHQVDLLGRKGTGPPSSPLTRQSPPSVRISVCPGLSLMVRESRSPPGPMPRSPLQTHPQLLRPSSEGGSVLRGAMPSRTRPRSGAQRTHSLEKPSTSRQVIKAEQRACRERVPWRGGEGWTWRGRGAGGREVQRAHGEAKVGAAPSKHWPGSVRGYSRHEVSQDLLFWSFRSRRAKWPVKLQVTACNMKLNPNSELLLRRGPLEREGGLGPGGKRRGGVGRREKGQSVSMPGPGPRRFTCKLI